MHRLRCYYKIVSFIARGAMLRGVYTYTAVTIITHSRPRASP
jgi:hypothetical protein